MDAALAGCTAEWELIKSCGLAGITLQVSQWEALAGAIAEIDAALAALGATAASAAPAQAKAGSKLLPLDT